MAPVADSLEFIDRVLELAWGSPSASMAAASGSETVTCPSAAGEIRSGAVYHYELRGMQLRDVLAEGCRHSEWPVDRRLWSLQRDRRPRGMDVGAVCADGRIPCIVFRHGGMVIRSDGGMFGDASRGDHVRPFENAGHPDATFVKTALALAETPRGQGAGRVGLIR